MRTLHPRGWLKPALGGLLILAGAYVFVAGLPDFSAGDGYRYTLLADLEPGSKGFPEVSGHYPIQRALRYRLEHGQAALELDVVEYQDDTGQPSRAIVYPPAGDTVGAREHGLRHDLWQEAMAALDGHAGADALFLGWWDDGQRIRFATGLPVWLDKPVAGAYADARESAFWRSVAGGFAPDETRARQLARWLTMDADAALADMAAVLPKDQPVYVLICLDDLARLAEIETLAGTRLPFEAKVFPAAANLHAQIAGVKRWAEETGVGAYLAQPLANGAVRAWRITSEAGVKTLLARLLPFTTSLTQPLPALKPVYQSGWGSYLTIYQWYPPPP
jgi:hydroxylamine oxidation protein HaoB